MRRILYTLGLALACLAPLAAALTSDDFYVNGTTLPGVSNQVGDIGHSWAGNIPLTPNGGPNDPSYFFWLFAPAEGAPTHDFTIYFAGGPGCSSAWSAFSGLGPFTVLQNNVVQLNPSSLTHTGWVLFLDQPLGTGFSKGAPDCADEECVANHFFNFMQNFYQIFPGLVGSRLNLAGQSYAGQMIPNIAKNVYRRGNPFNLKNLLIQSGRLNSDLWQSRAPAYDFAVNHRDVLQLTDTDIDEIKGLAESNGVGPDYLPRELLFPHPGPIHPPPFDFTRDVWQTIFNKSSAHNKCFTMYDVTLNCDNTPPEPWEAFVNGVQGFKAAIHADPTIQWVKCASQRVFTGGGEKGDNTPFIWEDGTIEEVLAGSENILLATTQDDFRFVAAGTLLSIQNVTWGGFQGFQEEPKNPYILDGKPIGIYHCERGLKYAYIENVGHDIQNRQPAAVLKLMRSLLDQPGG